MLVWVRPVATQALLSLGQQGRIGLRALTHPRTGLAGAQRVLARSTAMKMVGHKTESIYRRYAIVDEAMHREAAARLDAWAVEQKAKAEAERRGQVKRFKKRQSG